ncbi:hypothetical protein [Flavobacterium panici]|uniref:Uncharacterized protein n=1 Tax=Flavobacterium panici TaxID=2654843 RepID=A0A9N8J3L5_9FLAO|nr:hypothetical protein [Flavobacterium panici]CAC9974577.1 hypothetical protein FLAPXU55_02274 [Flavobacterium panici]
MDDNKLHIIPKITFRETYDKAMGSLVLEQAETFSVTIAEYEKDEKEIKKLEKRKNTARDFAVKKWQQHAEEGWDKKKLEENYNANMQDWEKANKAIQALEEKYNDVNWCWQLVGSKLDYNNLSHNKSFTKGIYQIKNTGKQSIQFPKLLEGGGMAWLEAFHEKEGAVGNTPYGIYVQAYGTPKIIRAEWTDFNYEPIKGSVGFMSKVILHIYTRAMYGQEVDIQLIDRDLFDPNDVLNAFESETFRGEVNIFKIKKNEIGKEGVSDLLTKSNEINTDNIVEKEQYVQKIELEVLIDANWEKLAGSNLQIFCTIKSKQTDTFFEGFERNYLNVDANSLILTAEKEVSNKPVLVGQVETNVGAFHHCQYTGINLEYEKGDKTEKQELYKEDPGVSENPNIEVGLILGSDPKKFSIKVDEESDTEECIYKDKPEDHGKNIFTFDKSKLSKNISITKHEPKSIEGIAYFDYDKIKLFDYFFLTDSKLKDLPQINIDANTCRHKHKINLLTVPDIKWEAYILIMSKTSESFSHTGMPSDKDSFGDPIVTENGKPTRKNIFEIHQKKARETGVSAKKMSKDFTGELHIKASTNNGANSFDYGATIEDKLNVILSTLSSVKEVLDSLSHRDEAVKGKAQEAMQTLKDKNVIGSKLPVFIEFSFPTIRLGGGWYWDMDKKDGKIKCIGNLQFGFEPLIQGKGGIDLVAAADYIPVVKPVLVALRYVKVGAQWLSDNTPVKIDSELYFNLYVKGKIDLRQTIDFINSSNDKTDVKISLLLGIELGFKIKASIEKVIYTKSDKAGGEEISKTGFDGQLSAEVESGFVGTATGGRDEKGMYQQFSADFTGITLKVVGKLTIHRKKKQPKNYGLNEKFDLVDYYKDICKSDKIYVL